MSLLDFLGGMAGAVPGVLKDVERREKEERRRQELEAERKRQEMLAEQMYARARADKIADIDSSRAYDQRLRDEEENRKAIERARAAAEREDAIAGAVGGQFGLSGDEVKRTAKTGLLQRTVEDASGGHTVNDDARAEKVIKRFNTALGRIKAGGNADAVFKEFREQDEQESFASKTEDEKREWLKNKAWRDGRDPAVAENQAAYWEAKAANEKSGGGPDRVKLKDQLTMADRQVGRAQQAMNAAQASLAALMAKAGEAVTKEQKKDFGLAVAERRKIVESTLAEFNAASSKLKALEDRVAGGAPSAAAPARDEEDRSNADNTIRPAADGLFNALIKQESGGQQFDKSGRPLTSKAGAIGIAQVMPSTAPEAARLAGVEFDDARYRNDPEYNSKLGRAYLNKQLEDFGDQAKALAAYNAGPERVRAAVEKAKNSGKPNDWLRYMPEETQRYVPAVLAGANSSAEKGPPAAAPDATKQDPAAVLADARKAIALNPANRGEVLRRLKAAGIDASSLEESAPTQAPAAPPQAAPAPRPQTEFERRRQEVIAREEQAKIDAEKRRAAMPENDPRVKRFDQLIEQATRANDRARVNMLMSERQRLLQELTGRG